MSDFPQCSPPTRPVPSAGKRSRRKGPRISEVQIVLQEVAAELRRLDRRLAEVGDPLPEPAASDSFDLLAEVRGAVDCVRMDLLADAIETLTAATTETGLRRRYEERQQWLAAE